MLSEALCTFVWDHLCNLRHVTSLVKGLLTCQEGKPKLFQLEHVVFHPYSQLMAFFQRLRIYLVCSVDSRGLRLVIGEL